MIGCSLFTPFLHSTPMGLTWLHARLPCLRYHPALRHFSLQITTLQPVSAHVQDSLWDIGIYGNACISTSAANVMTSFPLQLWWKRGDRWLQRRHSPWFCQNTWEGCFYRWFMWWCHSGHRNIQMGLSDTGVTVSMWFTVLRERGLSCMSTSF